MIAWALYLLIVSVLAFAAARATESGVRALGYPVRWVWGVALALVVGLAVAAPYRDAGTGRGAPAAGAPAASAVVTEMRNVSWTAIAIDRIGAVRHSVDGSMAALMHAAGRAVPRSVALAVGALWVAISLGLALLALRVQGRFRRARRDWPLAVLHGVQVRVSPGVGPVVIGVGRPEIVVPRWLFARAPGEQRLVVAHEAEHVRARDTLLLGAGCAVAALMPWNPVVWAMLSRLRLAVEMDCDARVLAGGAGARSYGTLLIDLAAHNTGWRLGVPALAGSSHLHQRILAMKTSRSTFARGRAAGFGALALVALLAACEATLPTSAEIDAMDVATAEAQATRMALIDSGSVRRYVVDGVEMSAAKAMDIAATSIAAIEVRKNGQGAGVINIRTKRDSSAALLVRDRVGVGDDAGSSRRAAEVRMVEGRRLAGSTDTIRAGVLLRSTESGTFHAVPDAGARAPAFYVDGVPSDASVLRRLDPKSIESVEVLKGKAAAKMIPDVGPHNGVVLITTKAGRPERP